MPRILREPSGVESPDLDRFALALDSDRSERRADRVGAECLPRRAADDDLTGLRGGHEPSRRIGGVADDREATALGGAHIAQDRRTGIDADPEGWPARAAGGDGTRRRHD